mgnify:FL=1|jgi:multiple sugar transport system permease protein|tara:strand:- start:2991 stop:3830 length:840 start_codon:yes stop_codon:yes gene_type:complete
MKNTNLKLFGLISASLILAVFTLSPLIWLIIMSVSSAAELTAKPLVWWPNAIDFSRYSDLLNMESGSGERFLMALRNSLITAITATLMALIISIPAAFSFSRRGASLVLLFGFLATIMMPPITYILPLYNIFGSLSLLNSSTALAIVYCAMLLPFATWLMKSNFDAIPAELDQASMVEGASTFYTLRRVILPLALPAIAATFMLSFLAAWDEFFYALIFTSDLSTKTLPVAIADFTAGRVTDYGVIAAVGVLASLPPAIVAMCFQRFIVSGLTAGSVKG